jgi:KDO2-lipid IV(A) lauroyltransferase
VRNEALWEHSRHWLNLRPVYALGRWLLENLPLPAAYAITWGTAAVAWRASPQIRKAIESNVRHVLSRTAPGLDEAGRARRARSIARQVFINRGTWFADLSVLAGCRAMDGLFRFEASGAWPRLQEALASGRGALLASAHLGNWHGGGVMVARRGLPVRSVLYRNHAADFMDRDVARRGGVRQTFVDPDPFSMMEIIRALRKGELVAVLADKPWDSRAIEAPFFGLPARFPLGPFRIARLAEVPIFPAFCIPERPRRYRAVLCDPIEVAGPDPLAAEQAAAARFARVLEDFVAPNLHVWFNFTPVWERP